MLWHIIERHFGAKLLIDKSTNLHMAEGKEAGMRGDIISKLKAMP